MGGWHLVRVDQLLKKIPCSSHSHTKNNKFGENCGRVGTKGSEREETQKEKT